MKKIGIILGVLFAIMVCGLGGVVWYAKTQVSPEEIRKLAEENISKAFPRSEVKIGSIDIGLGLSIGLDLAELNIQTRRGKSNYPLLDVKNVKVEIPVWSILMGGGNIEILLEKPKVDFISFGKENNWSYAMAADQKVKVEKSNAPKKDDAKKEEVADSSSESIELPSFATKSKLNLKVVDINLNYDLGKGQKGEIILSKFIVKNLNLETETGFELASSVKVNLSEKQEFRVDGRVIGQFNLGDALKKDSFKSIVVVDLKNMDLSGSGLKIPDVKTNVNTTIFKNGELKTEIDLSFLSNSKIKTKVFLNKKGIEVKPLQVELQLAELLSIPNDLKIDGLNVGESKISVDGEIFVSSKNKIYPNLMVKTTKPVEFKHALATVSTMLDGKIKDKNIDFKIDSKTLDGNILVNFFSPMNINKVPTDIAKFPRSKVDVTLTGVNLPVKEINKMMYQSTGDKKDEPKNEGTTKKVVPGTRPTNFVATPQPIIPPVGINVAFKRVGIGKNKFEGQFVASAKKNKVSLTKGNFSFSEGEGNVTSSSTLYANGKNATNFDFKMKNLNLEGFSFVLPPDVKKIEGVFTGTASGSVLMEPEFQKLGHNIKLAVDVKKGRLNGINIGNKVSGVLKSIPKSDMIVKQIPEVGDGFDSLTLNGDFTEKRYDIKKFYFQARKNRVEIIKSKGTIFPPPLTKEGSFEGVFKDNTGKVSKILSQEFGTKVLHFRLKGPGFALTPDTSYIAKKLAKTGVKHQAKKQGKKLIEKKGSKIVDKLLKGKNEKYKDKANKLLKGFFK